MIQPHFAAPGALSERRLLLISYHFPPGAATGALRWQKLAAYAADHGWQLDVVTLDPAQLRHVERERLSKLPPGTRVYTAARRPPRIERVVDVLRTPLAWWRTRSRATTAAAASANAGNDVVGGMLRAEDVARRSLGWRAPLYALRAWRHLSQDAGWAAEATRIALVLARHTRHACVISCGPPHAAHEAARIVARRTGLPFVLDLRDPWGETRLVDAYCASPTYFRILRRRQARGVAAASLVVVNTQTHLEALRRAYPHAATRITCVFNGCDEEPIATPRERTRFSIAYAGNIYFDRDPRPLFRAAARVIQEQRLSPQQFAIELIGDVHAFAGTSLAQLAAEAGIEPFVHAYPRRAREAALQFIANASVLLSLPQSAPLCIPSKIFEYMQFDAWILALAEQGSATELVLRNTGADVAAPEDEDAIAAILARRYAEYAAGVRPPRLIERNEQLTRRAQAHALFDLIGQITSAGRAHALTALPQPADVGVAGATT